MWEDVYGEGDNSAPLGKKVTLRSRHAVGLGARLESPAEGAACVKALNQGGGTGSRDAVMPQHHNIRPSPCLASPKDSTLYPRSSLTLLPFSYTGCQLGLASIVPKKQL